MCTLESVKAASELIGRMLSCVDDGMYTVTAIAHVGSGSGRYATFAALFRGEEIHTTGSDLACAEATSVALHAEDGGHLLLSCMDASDGVPRVLAWRLLAGEAIPMSAEETCEMLSVNNTLVMPTDQVGCMDAYPIPEVN